VTDRIRLDDLTSDALDALYAELAEAREQLRLVDGMRRQDLDSAAAAIQRAEHAEAALARVRDLHQPMQRGPFTICGHCSGWDGRRCLGVVTDYPCPTLTALDEPGSATTAAPVDTRETPSGLA
jgi:hypothetical protein